MDANITYLGFLAPFTLFFSQTRAFLGRILGVLWKTRDIPSEELSFKIYCYLKDNSYKIDLDNYSINNFTYFSTFYNHELPVYFKDNSFEVFFYKKFIPVFVTPNLMGGIKLSYLKFSFPFKQVFESSIKEHYDKIIESSKDVNRFYIEKIKGRYLKEMAISSQSVEKSELSSIKAEKFNPILQPWRIITSSVEGCLLLLKAKEVTFGAPYSKQNSYQFTKSGNYVLEQVRKWLSAEQWYRDKNITYKRGILLTSRAGHGKSSLIYNIAKTCKIPIFIFDLSSMDNSEFEKKINGLPDSAGIVLFEDFDVIFDGRKNLQSSSQYGGLTFDYFINKLSGVDSIKNKFIFITTNHLEKIDPAILRPGRMDEVIELESLNKEEKKKLAKIILSDDTLVERVMADGINDTTAEFENRAIQVALDNFWKTCKN